MTEQQPPINGYLCQMGPHVSCGACCGLYNIPNLSRDRLATLIEKRTRSFSRVPRTANAISDFGQTELGWDSSADRPFPRFHHCPYVGFIEDNGQRVGCMLHPHADGNDHTDWRGLSWYGGAACRNYFCPSCTQLSPVILAILQNSMTDWYRHGLLVTERRLLDEFIGELERRLGREVTSEEFPPGSPTAASIESLVDLKIKWPFRRKDAPGPCNYFFENGEYPRHRHRQAGDPVSPSPYDTLLTELDSCIDSSDTLHAAESLLDALLQDMVGLLKGAPHPS